MGYPKTTRITISAGERKRKGSILFVRISSGTYGKLVAIPHCNRLTFVIYENQESLFRPGLEVGNTIWALCTPFGNGIFGQLGKLCGGFTTREEQLHTGHVGIVV